VSGLPGSGAVFLDVSQLFIVKLIKQGALPCRMVGNHCRIPSDALLAHRDKVFRQAKIAADEMPQMAQELGLYELDAPPPKTW
jgi:excisionase family DNA binding protein